MLFNSVSVVTNSHTFWEQRKILEPIDIVKYPSNINSDVGQLTETTSYVERYSTAELASVPLVTFWRGKLPYALVTWHSRSSISCCRLWFSDSSLYVIYCLFVHSLGSFCCVYICYSFHLHTLWVHSWKHLHWSCLPRAPADFLFCRIKKYVTHIMMSSRCREILTHCLYKYSTIQLLRQAYLPCSFVFS